MVEEVVLHQSVTEVTAVARVGQMLGFDEVVKTLVVMVER